MTETLRCLLKTVKKGAGCGPRLPARNESDLAVTTLVS